VSDKAEKLSQEMQQQVRTTLSKTQSYELKSQFKSRYLSSGTERNFVDDGIQVKGKSPKASARQGLGREEARHS